MEEGLNELCRYGGGYVGGGNEVCRYGAGYVEEGMKCVDMRVGITM